MLGFGRGIVANGRTSSVWLSAMPSTGKATTGARVHRHLQAADQRPHPSRARAGSSRHPLAKARRSRAGRDRSPQDAHGNLPQAGELSSASVDTGNNGGHRQAFASTSMWSHGDPWPRFQTVSSSARKCRLYRKVSPSGSSASQVHCSAASTSFAVLATKARRTGGITVSGGAHRDRVGAEAPPGYLRRRRSLAAAGLQLAGDPSVFIAGREFWGR